MIDQRLSYLHDNPVAHGFVKRSEDYPWSSMAAYIGEEGMLDVEIIL